MVPSRNNQLIFKDINYFFAVSMILNGMWLLIFMANTKVAFVFAALDMAALMATNIYVMQKATNAKVNTIEFITLRVGFSVYAAWVTAAMILNIASNLRVNGMKDPSAGFAETTWVVIILYVALVIYLGASFIERNPLFGAVYIWVLIAIRTRQSAYSDI